MKEDYMLKEELEVIKQAIINEIEGYEFYKMAANQMEHLDSKEAFSTLSEEELKHTEYLKKLFESVKDEATDDFDLAFVADPPSPDIYKWKKVDKHGIGVAMSVFGVGMQMEKDAITFYEKARDNTAIKNAEKLYEILIQWEKVHLDQFTKQYEIYKEEWWLEQGFSPF